MQVLHCLNYYTFVADFFLFFLFWYGAGIMIHFIGREDLVIAGTAVSGPRCKSALKHVKEWDIRPKIREGTMCMHGRDGGEERKRRRGKCVRGMSTHPIYCKLDLSVTRAHFSGSCFLESKVQGYLYDNTVSPWPSHPRGFPQLTSMFFHRN